ncbi:type I restriction-modification system subunit M N-terminal domain-containing protein [Corynebacterium marquesiae]|uniref:type I restriction-modification system subunit M N-terminal domain-containing protein n=1 Tax=Corynebacterium marquesiae TaxID=2913503 RepID=UPI0030C9CA05
MNKQELASLIWESANNMRSKIEANEYKDYILGFEVSQVLFRLSRWENLEHAKEI